MAKELIFPPKPALSYWKSFSKILQYVQGRDLNKEVIEEIYEVGPKVGSELRYSALGSYACFNCYDYLYLVPLEFTFGLMGILAFYSHDVFLIVGFFALTGKEITMQIIAALLTIVGYSINDTIVIFNRIREDIEENHKDPIQVVFNRSINDTLSRTVITESELLLTSACLFMGWKCNSRFCFSYLPGYPFWNLFFYLCCQ